MQPLPYVFDRNEHLTSARARGDAWDVRDADGVKVGTISHGDGGWRVFSAGWGVPVDHHEQHHHRDAAVAALAEARRAASLPGGPLAIDESGLTGHQRAAIDMMRKYAMSSPEKLKPVIWDLFDMSPTQFYTEWNALIDEPLALAYAPTVINRHRRLREERKASRTRTPVPA